MCVVCMCMCVCSRERLRTWVQICTDLVLPCRQDRQWTHDQSGGGGGVGVGVGVVHGGRVEGNARVSRDDEGAGAGAGGWAEGNDGARDDDEDEDDDDDDGGGVVYEWVFCPTKTSPLFPQIIL